MGGGRPEQLPIQVREKRHWRGQDGLLLGGANVHVFARVKMWLRMQVSRPAPTVARW